MAHATVLYLGTEQGLWTLGSAGGSWRLTARGLEQFGITSVMLHPTQLLTFYTAAESDSIAPLPPGGGGTSGLYRSENGGADWQSVLKGTITAVTLATDGARRRRTRTREDEADEEEPFALLASVAPTHLYRSDDGGATWQPLTALAEMAGYEEEPSALLAPDRNDIYAGFTDGRIFYSADGGASWQLRSTLMGYIYRIITHADSLYAVTSAGIHRSDDGGDTWAERSGEFVASGGLAAFAPTDEEPAGVLLAEGRAAEGQGVFRSTDGGTTWQRCGGLASNEDFVAVQIHPNVRGAAYAISLHHAYATEDKGQTWERIESPDISTVNALAVAKI